MQYQLVLQWGADSLSDYDELIAIEDVLLAGLASPNTHVDGHDIGSGQMNIFIWTDRPRQAFAEAGECLAGDVHWSGVRAAYRLADEDEFTTLWPESLHAFEVL